MASEGLNGMHGRHVELEDASDRAQGFRQPQLLRIKLEQILVWPQNRGGQGIIPFHVHEVASDIMQNKTSAARYGHVCLVEVPRDKLDEVLEFNLKKARADSRLPRVSINEGKYFCLLTKTHFVHAHKLAKDGNHTLFGKEKGKRIQWTANDREGQEILQYGPTCCIYREGLFGDTGALKSLAIEDNLNAQIQMGDDEMAAFGRVHAQHAEEEKKLKSRYFDDWVQHKDKMHSDILSGITFDGGLKPFSETDWNALIQFRMGLTKEITEVMIHCYQSLSAGMTRVRIYDWGLLAKLDKRAPFAKVCLLMMQYVSPLSAIKPEGSAMTFHIQVARTDNFATRLSKEIVNELEHEGTFCCRVQDVVIQLISEYKIPEGGEDFMTEVYKCRGHLMSNAGKLMKQVAVDLVSEAKKKKARKDSFSITDRQKVIEAKSAPLFIKLEKDYRESLVKNGVLEEASLPPWKFKEDTKPEAQDKKPEAQAQTMRFVIKCGGEDVTLTAADVFENLGVEGLGEDVMAFVRTGKVKVEVRDNGASGLAEIATSESPALSVDNSAAASSPAAASSSQDPELPTLPLPLMQGAEVGAAPDAEQRGEEGGSGEWVVATLEDLVPPGDAQVKVHYTAATVQVKLDNLRRMPKKDKDDKDKKGIKRHPTLMDEEDGTRMDAYTFGAIDKEALKIVFQQAILQSHLSTVDQFVSTMGPVDQISVTCLSETTDDGYKLPLVLQARATAEFPAKGKLLLFPYTDNIQFDSADTARFLEKHGGESWELWQKSGLCCCLHKTGTLHEAMHMAVAGSAVTSKKGKRRRIGDGHVAPPPDINLGFVCISPLLQGKEQKKRNAVLENVNPFWALLRAPTTHATPNMKIDTLVVTVPSCTVDAGEPHKGWKFQADHRFTVSLQYAVNTRPIKEGEVLMLPFEP